MKIFVKAKPGHRENKVEQVDATHFVVAVTEQPIDGKASRAIEKLLAEHFKKAPSLVRIVSGWNSKNKVVEIE